MAIPILSLLIINRIGTWLGIEQQNGIYRWMDGTYPEWSLWDASSTFDNPHVQAIRAGSARPWSSSSDYSSGSITCVTQDSKFEKLLHSI